MRFPARCRRAFTLMETTVSLAVMSITMVGVGSVFVLAAQVLPGSDSRVDRGIETQAGLSTLAHELRYAIYIAERTATAITFTVNDRDGDGSPERIRYAWDGTPGSPLTRTYNGGTPAPVIDHVTALHLDYHTTSVTETYPGPIVESVEQVIDSHNATTGTNTKTIKDTNWLAQLVTVPSGATSWRPTRVEYRACQEGVDDGELLVQIRSNDASGVDPQPSDTILVEEPVEEHTLPTSTEWVETAFSNDVSLATGMDYQLVFASNDVSGKAAKVQYADGTGYGWTSDTVATWDIRYDRAVRYTLHGVYLTAGPDQTLTRDYGTAVTVSLSIDGTDTINRQQRIALPNRPEVLTAIWEADFEHDPTLLDINADGVGDWVHKDGQPFSMPPVSDGVWTIDNELECYPPNRNSEPVTAVVHMRPILSDGSFIAFRIINEHAVNEYSVVCVEVTLEADNTQTVELKTFPNALWSTTLATITGLDTNTKKVRMVVDPAALTTHLTIDGVDHGTYTIDCMNSHIVWDDRPYVSIYASYGAAEVDYVSVRVGGTGG